MTRAAGSTLEIPLPADPMVPRPAVIRSITPEANGVSTYELQFTDDPQAELEFRPGQFNMIYVPGVGEVAISISSDPAERKTFSHTILVAGNVTRAISRLHPGNYLGVRGPYGSHWPVNTARGRDLLIVSGGVGFAPLRPVILDVLSRRSEFRRVIVLYGARTPTDLLFAREYAKWKDADIELHAMVDRADESWKGEIGVVPLLFYRIRFEPKETVVFTCGPDIMMRFVLYESMARRVPMDSMWVSLERNMKCAVGFCGHCQYGPLFICRDGPVLNFEDIEPFFNREEF